MSYTFDFSIFLRYSEMIAAGLAVTVALAVAASAIGIGLGGALALGRRSRHRAVRVAISAYVEFLRNTPFVVQLFFFYFGLPSLGIRLGAWQCALLAMSINLSAYAAEIIRAGLDAIPQGQVEAARALGLSLPVAFRLVVLPQAVAIVYPALTAQVVITTLETAVVSKIAVSDLSYVAETIQADTFRAFEVYFAITLVYLCLTLLMRRAFARFGQRFVAKSLA